MIQLINNKTRKPLVTGGLFIILFLYFALFNKYHILYLEQNQLFLFNFSFLKEQFMLPGGLALYTGRFFTQFFISSWAGALIFTVNAFITFVLSVYIFKKHKLNNIIAAFVPVWLLVILHSNELFSFDQAIGFLFLISYFALYISISKQMRRYIFYFIGWPVLYLLLGGFSIPAILLCTIHELLFRKHKNHRIIAISYTITGILVPFLFANILFYIPDKEIFIHPVFFGFHPFFRYALILLLAWNPLLLLANFFLGKVTALINRLFPWNLKNVLTGTVIFALMGFVVYKYAYSNRAELMLGIDHHVQQGEWEDVLELSDKYPDLNTFVIYYTNLALYKTGHMSDKLFSYPQIGAQGLRLKWERNTNLFFGGDVFYYLSYTNEAYRWAFEASVAKGLNPRSLKRLVITCLTNGDNAIARKYIHKLKQTFFYREWAERYEIFLKDPALTKNNPEISHNLDLLIHSDFISNAYNLNLDDLLLNHPGNKMAYEYFMASLLLEKNLDEFARYILRIKEYGYSRLPLHFEEALIFYNSYLNKEVKPEGYSINPETLRRFEDYATMYTAYRGDIAVAASQLKSRYGKTYWYYLQFINNPR